MIQRCLLCCAAVLPCCCCGFLSQGAHDDHAAKTAASAANSTRRRGEGNTWRGIGLPPQYQQIYARGRPLLDDFLVQECGITDNSLIQVFIKPTYRA